MKDDETPVWNVVHSCLGTECVIALCRLGETAIQAPINCAQERRLSMDHDRVILVTGASSGIGLETARLLNDEGYRVFGTHLPGEDVSYQAFRMVALDVTSDASVSACVAQVLGEAGRLDVLYNNAGVGLVGMVEETSIEECRLVMEINYYGAVRMVREALPAMREQGSGLIINTSSVAGHLAVPYEAHYCAMKLAVDSFTRALRHEVRPFGIDAVVMAPGYVRTSFYDVLRRPSEELDVYAPGRERAVEAFAASARQGNEAAAIAPVILRIIRSRSPRMRYWAGRDAKLYAWSRQLIPDAVMDWALRRQFSPA